MLRKYLALFLFTTLVCPAFATVPPTVTIVKFGANNQLVVNTATGLFSVKYCAKMVVTDAVAAYAVGDDKYGTNSYIKRTIHLENDSDKLGMGKLLTLTSTKAGIPTMIQRFYCYRDKNFIVTELEIQGEALKSNY